MTVYGARSAILCLILVAIFSGTASAKESAGALSLEGIWILDMGENINGSFVQSDSLGRMTCGKAAGFKINSNVSEYQPVVEMMPTASPIKQTTAPATEETKTAKPIEDKSRFVDVTTQSDRVFYLGWAWKPDKRIEENGYSEINSTAVL